MSSRAPDGGSEPLLLLGETTWRRSHQSFGLFAEDRLRHLYLLGKTGSGKSTLIANLVIQDLREGRGVALLDPHGDLVESVLPHVPASRVNETLLLSPEDRAHPISFNVFRRGRDHHPDPGFLSSQLVSLFRKLWADSWGPRLEHVLRNAVLAVAPDPRATLLFLYRFLTDETLRNGVSARIADPVVRQFWTREFPSYGRALQAEALAPVLNKLGAFVTNPLTRNLIGQSRSRVDLVDLMARRGIVLADLATGRIGEDASRLLGGLLMTALQLAAMERPRGSPPFYVYADEFQHFVSDALSTMLSEARKFGLGLTLAHQYLGQLPPGLRDAVIGNVGSLMVFRVGGDDAETLARELHPPFTGYDLMTLPRYNVAARLIARGTALAPFSARTHPQPPPPPYAADRIAAIRAQSRLRFARPQGEVERAIENDFGT